MKLRYKILILLIVLVGGAVFAGSQFEPVRAAARKIITTLSGKTTIKSVANNSGLLVYWDFDDCDTCTTVADRSGNSNTGTMYNDGAGGVLNLHTASSSSSGFKGKIGGGALFDGSDDYVDIAAPPMTAVNNWTMAAWMNPANLNQLGFAVQNGIDAGSCGTNRGYGFGVGNGSGSAGSKLQGVVTCVAWVDSGYTFPAADRWYHVVMQRDNGTIKFFVDGVQTSGTSASVPGTPITNARIGSQTGQRFFHGSVDDARMYNRVLSIAEIKNLYNSTRKMFVNMPQNNLLTDGLVGYWPFNGPDMSGATAYDRSGSGNNGTLVNGPTAIPGIIGQALNFDGSNDYVNTNYNESLSTLTFSAWIRLNSFGEGNLGRIVDKRQSAAQVLLFYVDGRTATDNQLVFDRNFDITSGSWTTPTDSILANRWYHVAATYNDTSITNDPVIYINGVAQSLGEVSPDGTAQTNTDNYLIGNRGAIDRTFDGSIDEFRIYNRILTAAEVLQLYTAGKR